MTDDEPDCTRKGMGWISFIIKPHRRIRKRAIKLRKKMRIK